MFQQTFSLWRNIIKEGKYFYIIKNIANELKSWYSEKDQFKLCAQYCITGVLLDSFWIKLATPFFFNCIIGTPS